KRLRVLFVIPGNGERHSMIFARREAAALRERGIEIREFFLTSRTSLPGLVQELRRFRNEIHSFAPDLVHAQFGTITAMFVALGATGRPMVVTYRGSDLNPRPGAARVRAVVTRLLSQFAALRARRIVCVSRELRARLWWRRARVTVL